MGEDNRSKSDGNDNIILPLFFYHLIPIKLFIHKICQEDSISQNGIHE